MARQFSINDSSVWNDRFGSGSDGVVVANSGTTEEYKVANGATFNSSSAANTFGYISGSVSAGGTQAWVVDAWGFNSSWTFAGDLVVIWQTQGTGAGAWELNKVSSGISSGTQYVTFAYPFQNNYGPGTQFIKFPQYNTFTINAGTTFVPVAWNGTYGGLMGWFSNSTATNNGAITLTGRGFRGGPNGNYPISQQGEGYPHIGYQSDQIGDNALNANGNGGGGGSRDPTNGVWHQAGGGGGGGNGTAGGAAYWAGGANTCRNGNGGGVASNSGLTLFYLGGGGGAGGQANGSTDGAGGAGSAGLMVFSQRFINEGTITLAGLIGHQNSDASSSGCGGSGAGGAALFKGQQVYLSGINNNRGTVVTANGAGAQTFGPYLVGGYGGEGVVHVDYASVASGTASPAATATFDSGLYDPSPNYVKADIIVFNNTDASQLHANILHTYTDDNSVKVNMIKHRGICDSSTRAQIRGSAYYKKRYGYRLYYSDTDIRDVWGDEVLSEPSFRMQINSGPGEVVIKLAREIDAFGEDDDIVLNRKLDIYVYDKEAPQGRLLYQGFISAYAPVLDGTDEYLEITVLGYVVEIGQRMLKDGNGATTLTYSDDPSNIIKDVIGKYQADSGHLTYSDSSIETTSTTVSYTFSVNTIKEVFDKIIELTPYDWYWRIDPDGLVYLKRRSTVADHKFYIGKHIIYMRPEKRIEALRNALYFIGGTPAGQSQIYRKYTRTSSVNTYGLREDKYNDSRVTLTATADTKATRWLDERDEPEIRTVLRIADSNGQDANLGYDIESIKPGDTISIENLKSSQKEITLWDRAIWDSSKWDFESSLITADVLHVITVSYNPDYVEIEAASALPIVAKRIEDIERNVQSLTTTDLPTTPTNA